MELRLILAAIRRSRLIIIVTTIACTIPAIGLWLTRSTTYEAKTVLYIQPPAAQAGGNVNYNDPDRYVASQIGVLESGSLSATVAKQLSESDVKAIQRSVTFTHLPKSDLITIVAKHPKGASAIAIANAFAESYVREQAAAVKKSQEPAVAALEKRLATISAGLEAADLLLTADPTDSQTLVRRDALLAQYGEIVRAKTTLEFVSRVDARSAVLDRATSAFANSGTSLPLQLAAGLFVGLGLGMAIALAIMMFSPTLSDNGQLEEITGAPPIGPVRSFSNFPTDRSTVVAKEGWPFATLAKNIAMRAEAVVPEDATSITIGIVSPLAHTGVTALAAGVSGFFARSGSQVVLVDANDVSPALTTEFNATDGEKFIRYVDESLTRQTQIEQNWLSHVLASTPAENVHVLGGTARFLNRGNLPTVVNALRNYSKVTVVDCGSMDNSPTAQRLAPLLDVIVYVVPVNRVRVADLKVSLSQFRDTPVIVTLTRVGARQFFFG